MSLINVPFLYKKVLYNRVHDLVISKSLSHPVGVPKTGPKRKIKKNLAYREILKLNKNLRKYLGLKKFKKIILEKLLGKSWKNFWARGRYLLSELSFQEQIPY